MGEPSRILVVDDESSIRGILNETLSQIGCQVTEAASAEEALKTLEHEMFHLVLTDIRMPGLSGIELLQRIKKRPIDTEVIVMTSHASLESSVQAIHLGAYDYLLKPFEELESIEMVVRRALDKQALKRENQRLVASLKQKNEELTAATQKAAHILVESKGFYGMLRHLLEANGREDLLERLCQVLLKNSKGQPCLVWLYDPDKRALVMEKAAGLSREARISPIPLQEESSRSPASLTAWLSKRGYLSELARSLREIRPSAAVDLPVVFQGKGMGLLVLLNRRSEELALHETAFLENIGLLAGAVLDRVGAGSRSDSASFQRAPEGLIAVRDTRTPLYSFDYFLELLQMEVGRSRRYRHKFVLIMTAFAFPPDRKEEFSPLLQELAVRFQRRTRMTDIAARCEEKFFILLPETDYENAEKVMKGLLEEIDSFPPSKETQRGGGRPKGMLTAVEYPRDGDEPEGLMTALETKLARETEGRSGHLHLSSDLDGS